MLQQSYICVNCGHPTSELYKRFRESIIKLSNCDKCKLICDKYVEYDPVILMVDIVLLSKEAYRHVLNNTKFAVFWKLVVALLFMETYNVWSLEYVMKRNECMNSPHWWLNLKLFLHHVDSTTCVSNITNMELPEESFLSEEGFYKTFVRILIGSVVFTITVSILMTICSKCLASINEVDFKMLCKAVTLGSLGMFFSLPTIIWGKYPDYFIHSTLCLGYTLFGLVNVISILYNSKKHVTAVIILTSYFVKCYTLDYTKYGIEIVTSVDFTLP